MTDLEKKEYDSKRKKIYYLKNKIKIRAKANANYLKNKDKITKSNKKYFDANKEKIAEKRKEYHKKNKQYLNECGRKYSKENREKINKKRKQYIEINKQKFIEYNKNYRKENAIKIRDNVNKKRNNKRKTEPLYKLKCNIRDLIRVSIKNNGYSKSSKTLEILGCSFEDFKKHIERQFTSGMNWNNRKDWHLDHIYPISLAKDEVEVIKLNHYTNFQPMWTIENIKKGNKIIPNTQIKLL